jgi:phosphoribosyl 1,2-cyclic phosphate phosphodiesterase
MELILQGTGGADGIPSFFADSRVSDFASKHGGKDVRTRSAAIIDRSLKIDLGPDTFAQAVKSGIRPTEWDALLITHTHDDHLCVSELQYMFHPFTPSIEAAFPIFGNAVAVAKIQDRYDAWPFDLFETRSFAPFQVGEYEVHPVKAYHKLDEDAHNFVIRRGDSCLLYATDTGVWEEPTWDYLAQFKLSGMVIECTDGTQESTYDGHLNIPTMLGMIDRLVKLGVVSGDTQIVTTHHVASGDCTHAELESILAPHGILPGFDGMILRV